MGQIMTNNLDLWALLNEANKKVESSVKDEPDENADDDIDIPSELPILPLRGLVVYPQTAIPLTVGQPRSIKLVDDVVAANRLVGLVTAHDPELETPGPDDVYRTGTLAS